ncbi:Rieske (2Fe-2S) protein [Pseudomonas sp. NPDC077649]|uniref:Rieske (2Fe-2S) protein n=1 Tax=Pseudomonas sp. NPDC077649 TaxID=3364423 RepID=UPI0037CAE51E
MFIALERLINLDEGYRRSFQVAGRSLLLLVVEGQPVLLENRCPHQGAPLHDASLQGRVLRTPWRRVRPAQRAGAERPVRRVVPVARGLRRRPHRCRPLAVSPIHC